MIPVRPFGCGSEPAWNRSAVGQLTSFQIHSLHFFRCSSLFQGSMPHFTDAERPGGVQRLRNVEELMAYPDKPWATNLPRKSPGWCWKCPHEFSPWIFRSQKWQRLEKAMVKAAIAPGPSFCCGQALLLKEDIWCYPSPVPWDMTPRPHSGLPRAPAQPWLPCAAKIEALPVQRVGPPCCGRFQQLNCKQITKRKNVIRVQRCKANHP